MFGRWVQRLTKKSADTLIAENPQGFIPNEITRLLEKAFIWNVSFTKNTTSSGRICFQVNAVVGEINDRNALLPMTPTGSQSSSLMLSQGAGSSMHGTPQKSAALPLLSPPTASEASHASSATPTKKTLNIPELPVTPQSRRCTNEDEITPKKGAELTLPLAEEDTKPIGALATLTHDTATMSPGNDDTTLAKSTGKPGISKDVAGNSATKTQKSAARKRSLTSLTRKSPRSCSLMKSLETKMMVLQRTLLSLSPRVDVQDEQGDALILSLPSCSELSTCSSWSDVRHSSSEKLDLLMID